MVGDNILFLNLGGGDAHILKKIPYAGHKFKLYICFILILL
jgi:hypothetical protein